jgi:hypothetical protein
MGWANRLVGWVSGNGAEVNAANALLVTDIPPHADAYVIAAKSGTIAAALAAGACVFGMRLNPSSGAMKAYIDSIRIRYTTIVPFTTPVTATRSLVVTRGAGGAISGGTNIPVANPKETAYAASQFDQAVGGSVAIATTGALTTTGITWETVNFGEPTLIHCGTAGAYYEVIYEYSVRSHPIELLAGQLIGLRVGASAMDAGGTWVTDVEVNWHESATYAG